MPSPETLALFALATLALVATPGAGIVYVITQTVDRGRGAGVESALGIELADLTHMLAAVLGVSALLAASDLAYDVLKYAGAAYLIGLGVYKLLTGSRAASEPSAPPARGRVFGQGYAMQLLNPKPALFFAAFLPQFIDPGEPVATQMIVLAAVYLAVALACDLTYVLLAGALRARLATERNRTRIARLSAATYIALGALAALTGSKPAKAAG